MEPYKINMKLYKTEGAGKPEFANIKTAPEDPKEMPTAQRRTPKQQKGELVTATREALTVKPTAARGAAAESLTTSATNTTMATTMEPIPGAVVVMKKPEIPAATKKTIQTVSRTLTLTEFRRYKQWPTTKQERKNESHATIDGCIRMPCVAVIATTETPTMPEAKRNMMKTSKISKMLAQVVR